MKRREVFSTAVLLLCALTAPSYGVESSYFGGSGSGSASGLTPIPPQCNNPELQQSVTLFDAVVETLSSLNCSVEDGDYLDYISVGFGIDLSETDTSAIFGDYLSYSTTPQIIELDVCSAFYGLCEYFNLNVTTVQYKNKLLPFGNNFSDIYLVNADDRAAAILTPNNFPFWNRYYNSLYLSTNGLASFGQPFTQWWPVQFPYGWSTVPVLAPYWNDMDFRNGLENSALYYHMYTNSGSKRDEAFLELFSDRLESYAGTNTFIPDWVLIATWYKATPYYGYHYIDEVLTFQLVLATDSVDTYTFFLYEEDGLNWNRNRRTIVVGYDAKDYINYHSLQTDTSEDYLQLDSIQGNTGEDGEWYFKLTSSNGTENYAQECLKWAQSQDKDVVKNYFDGLPACPGTMWQAWRDWRFWFGWRWGLTSRPNCAALVWSRRQSTVECCYDTSSGALLLGPENGGSYRLYHPWFSNMNYILEDKNPYEYCCELSDMCSVFYTHRPSVDSTGYDPSFLSFAWGDPHFKTIDNNNYTFNAIGEYTLLQSPTNNMTIQVRLKQLDTPINATVIAAVAVKHGSVQTIQVEEVDGKIALYVNGTIVSIPSTNEDFNLIVTEYSTYESVESFLGSTQNVLTTDYISVRYNMDDLVITLSSGVSLMIVNSSSFLHVAVEVGSSFINATQGLLGFFNENLMDDFYLPNGTIVPYNSSEKELFYYGLEWHVEKDQSIFSYFDVNTYDTYNNEWNTFVPTFTDDLTTPADAMDVCGDSDPQCVFDYAVTGDMSVALATHAITQENLDIVQTLENHPPNISGPLIIYVERSVDVSESYSVQDIDDHTISIFELKAPVPSGIVFDVSVDGLSAQLSWSGPDTQLPSSAIQLFANDNLGAATLRNISIVLCACTNNGTCINATTHQYNNDGHYLQPCLCAEGFSGDLCEEDRRGCTDTSCPDYSVCVENASIPLGFTCTDCQDGYTLDEDGKCTDVNECNTTDLAFLHNCDHICINTDGSYLCQCMDGYTLDVNGANCTDNDECYDGTANCKDDEMCTNTAGSFTCSFIFPLSPLGESCLAGTCDVATTCHNHTNSTGQGSCICTDIGKYCVGDCTGDTDTLQQGSQSCESCPPNRYGYRCMRMCDCVSGDCDAVKGCICNPGITGEHCEKEINQMAPEFEEDTIKKLTLSQNLPSGAVLNQFNATDNDIGPAGEIIYSLSHSYQLPVNISSGEGIFELGNTTGVLVLVQDLNTTQGLYTEFVLTVVASDRGVTPLSTETVVSVLIEDTPAPIPSFREDEYEVLIPESTTANSTILNLTCSEPEGATGAGDLTTMLLSSNDSTLFSLEGRYDNLTLVLLEEIDYESLTDTTPPHYTLNLTCVNAFTISTTSVVEIEIGNVNDNPFEFENTTYNVEIPENRPRYYEVYKVIAFDPDIPDGEIRYDLTDPGVFNIYPTNGTIYISNPPIDREVRDNYTLDVSATLGLQTAEATVNIVISDLNDNVPRFPGVYFSLDNISTSNSVGDTVVIVTAQDGDYENNGSIVYSIESNPLFDINGTTGEIYIYSNDIKTIFGSFILYIYASDEGTPASNTSTKIDIYVAQTPDTIRFQNLSTSVSIEEDLSRGSKVLCISAAVFDRNNRTIDPIYTDDVEYTLTGVNVSDKFTIVSHTGDIILLSSLDFEVQQSYILQIEASVPNQNILEAINATIEIVVTDVNDNAPLFSPTFYATVVEEFTDLGTRVFTVSASDIDSGDNENITYKIMGGISVPFFIDPSTGEITVNDTLDTPRDYRFSVLAVDGGTPMLSSEAVVFISVVRSASVQPEFDRQLYNFNVTEGLGSETTIGVVAAHVFGNNTIDQYTHLSYRLQKPDQNSNTTLFHVDPTTGVLSTLSVFDTESQDQYAFYVDVYNATNTSKTFDSALVEVEITDINDNSPIFLQSLYTSVITTAEPANSTLLQVVAMDKDKSSLNSQFTFNLLSDFLGFGITTGGDIQVVNSTLYPGEYHMTVEATDGGSPPNTGSATVFISVIPADTQEITFEENAYSFEISEDTQPNVSVGRVVALDHNNLTFANDSGLQYLPINSDTVNCLHIGEYSGVIRVACGLDRETQATYSFAVTATFGSNATGQVMVEVTLLDVNDNAPVFTRDVYSQVVVTTYSNTTAVLSVQALDRDFGSNATIEYTFEGGATENDVFRIAPMTGEIFFLKHENEPGDFQFLVMASDMGTPEPQKATAAVSICVIPERPTRSLQIVTTKFSTAENQPSGTVVGVVQLETGGTFLPPEDYQNNLEFLITGGDSQHLFFINPDNGTLQVIGTLDREEAASHVIEVEAVFRDFSISVNTSILITVTDENDNSPMFIPSILSSVIDDGYTFNQTVPHTNFLVTDRDAGSNAEMTFSISEMNPFGVRSTPISTGQLQGEIYIHNVSLLLPGEDYSFQVRATDGGEPTMSSSTTVLIIVEHVVPESISFELPEYEFTHTENSLPFTPVGNVSIVQVTPALDELVYGVSGGTGEYVFSVNPISGEIYNLLSVDREHIDQYSLNITAHLPSAPDLQPATTTVFITIEDENDNMPVFSAASYVLRVTTDVVLVNEPLINVSASDRDIGPNAELTYTIPNSDGLFNIDVNGNIIQTELLPAMAYHLIVEARDNGITPLTGVALVVIDIREAVPAVITFNQSEYTFFLSEYELSGSAVGVVFLDLHVLSDYVQYVSFSAESENFHVGAQSGDIRSRRTFDYESFTGQPSIEFIVNCSLNLPQESPPVFLTASATITVNILDENDNRPVFIDFPTTLQSYENTTQETNITRIMATDADSGDNGKLYYRIVNDVNTAIFRINSSTGDVFVQSHLDREVQDMYFITIQVSDEGTPPLSADKAITFTLLDINDNIPVLVENEFSVTERFIGNVFTLNFSDSDLGNFGDATFHIVQSDYSNHFSVATSNGKVQLLQELDYEIEPTLQLTVRLQDNPGGPGIQNSPQYTVTVNVIDMPDNPPVIDFLDNLSIDPRAESGDIVVTITSTDDDGDDITYSIEVTPELPELLITSPNGRLSFNSAVTLVPDDVFTVLITATDDSQYTLSSTATFTITILPETLEFEEMLYEEELPEDSSTGTTVATLIIKPLSQSSGISFGYQVTSPSGDNPFRSHTEDDRIFIILNQGLDRESVGSYSLTVTATRASEMTETDLIITVLDVNDNAPVITSDDRSFSIPEGSSQSTLIGIITATDDDIDENSDLVFTLPTPGTPFTINNNGRLRVDGSLDFETEESYTFDITVSDSGSNPMSTTVEFTVTLININDNAPTFMAPAYFGELNTDAPNNINIHHVILEVMDNDGEEQEFSFSISLKPGSQASGYKLRVSDQPPYYVRAAAIPENAASEVIDFNVEVSDGVHTSQTVLYLSVYSPEHLLTFTINGVSKEEFLLCSNSRTSLCVFEESLSLISFELNGELVSYYNDSVEESETDTQQLIVKLYGWYGEYGPRSDNGQEETNQLTASVRYLTYTDIQLNSLSTHVTSLHDFDFGIDLSTTTEPTEEPTTSGGLFDNTTIVGIICGTVLLVLIIGLVIVVLLSINRRRKPKKRGRDKDPYDLNYPRRTHRTRASDRGTEKLALTSRGASSDLAYETMYDDDELLDQQQTMPWFDPNYLAPEKDEYDGDAEMNSRHATDQRQAPLRATVDGDARRNRRHSSDESAGGESVTELDRSHYLRQYQQGEPMKPGQRLGEYDIMFLKSPDTTQPYRPSLQTIPGYKAKRGSQA